MYAALATKSECCLSVSLFHEDDIRRSHSLDEQFDGPADFRDQRVPFDEELVRVVGPVRQARVLAQLNVVTRNREVADVRLARIRRAVNGLVERELVPPVGSQIQAG